MKDMTGFTKYLSERYDAQELQEERCRKWLGEGEKFIAGYEFSGSSINLRLLTLTDYRYCLTDEEKRACMDSGVFPFPKMVSVVYENTDNEILMKTINGVSGVLNELFKAWMSGCEDKA